MNKEQKQELNRLKKEKNYEEIFTRFGQKEFEKSVDEKYKNSDIAKLKKEGKYEDIYLRYGESEYKDLLHEAKQREIELAYGKKSIKAISNKIKYKIKSTLSIILYSLGILGMQQGTMQIASTVLESEMIKNENEKEYSELINEYEEKVNSYAENIKKMDLNDLEIIMKLQDDMHKSIQGYGLPTIDIEGYFGVDIGQEGGEGVCRNMAEDIARKLNAINPEYNARMFTVKYRHGEIEEPDIQKNHVNNLAIGTKFDDTQIRNTIHGIYYITQNEDVYNVLANHAVVAVDIKEKNVTLIIDPTNLCLGVFNNGKITIFNSLGKDNPITMYRTPLDDVAYRGIGSLNVPSEYIKSFLNPFLSMEELNQEYGIEAQNDALESARKKEENYIYKVSNENNFKNSLKVDINNVQQSIYTVEEIEQLYEESMQKIVNASKEEVIELANICRKIAYSINYYNNEQENIIGKSINYGERISDKVDLDLSELKNAIAYKMVETEAVILPNTSNIGEKEFLSIVYLQSGENEKLNELKVAFDTTNNIYYILNDREVLGKMTVSINNNGERRGMVYSEHDIQVTQEEIEHLLEESKCITEVQDMPIVSLGEERGDTSIKKYEDTYIQDR